MSDPKIETTTDAKPLATIDLATPTTESTPADLDQRFLDARPTLLRMLAAMRQWGGQSSLLERS